MASSLSSAWISLFPPTIPFRRHSTYMGIYLRRRMHTCLTDFHDMLHMRSNLGSFQASGAKAAPCMDSLMSWCVAITNGHTRNQLCKGQDAWQEGADNARPSLVEECPGPSRQVRPTDLWDMRWPTEDLAAYCHQRVTAVLPLGRAGGRRWRWGARWLCREMASSNALTHLNCPSDTCMLTVVMDITALWLASDSWVTGRGRWLATRGRLAATGCRSHSGGGEVCLTGNALRCFSPSRSYRIQPLTGDMTNWRPGTSRLLWIPGMKSLFQWDRAILSQAPGSGLYGSLATSKYTAKRLSLALCKPSAAAEKRSHVNPIPRSCKG